MKLKAMLICLLLPVGAGVCAPSVSEVLAQTGLSGGLIVRLGCDSPQQLAQLRTSDACLVYGLDADGKKVQAVRDALQRQGLLGGVSAGAFDGQHLPFINDVVNVFVADTLGGVSPSEVRRVLAPNGVALIGGKRTVKPWPAELHDWPHYLGDADNNAVSDDQPVGGPRALQWWAGPLWTRYHDRLASTSSVVTSGGRVFYIVDRGSITASTFDPEWFVEARDAFNGILLWRHPMQRWASHLRKFRSGPVQIARLLVAKGDRVYTTLSIGEPVTVLDAATGKSLAELGNTTNAEELILDEGMLLTVVGVETAEHAYEAKADYRKKRVVAVDPVQNRELWHWPATGAADIVPQSLAAGGGRVLLQDGYETVCLNQKDGVEAWRTATFAAPKPPKATKQQSKRKPAATRSPGWDYATLVIYDDVVLSTDGKVLCALTADSGKKLWECPAKTPFGRVPSVDVLVVDDLVWISPLLNEGRDLHTGEVKKTLELTTTLTTAGHHHRCYRNKGVGDFLIFGHRGMDFYDTKGDRHSRNNWIRGLCQYGVMPANGLFYAPPNNCGCYPEALLHGFVAVGDERRLTPVADDFAGRLERVSPSAAGTGAPSASPADWPEYRGGAARRGVVNASLPAALHPAWQAELGGQLTAPVVAEGNVLLARKDNFTVYALDQQSGKVRWQYAAGAPVDSPPSIYAGRVLFGSHDGAVYCLRLTDGQLLWRFNAAPSDRKTVALGHVESLWPVPGSILVKNGTAYFAAGRSTYLDGGMFLFGLDALTGEVRYRTHLQGAYPGPMKNNTGVEPVRISQNKTDYKTLAAPDRSDAFSMEGNTMDVMVADNDSVYLRHMRFNDQLKRQRQPKHHLFATGSLLDDSESHRLDWFFGNGDLSGLNVAYEWITRGRYGGFSAPFGTLLVFDDATVWGVEGHDDKGVMFASPIAGIDQRLKKDFPAPQGRKFPERNWQQPLPLHPRALVKAGSVLYLGGAPDTQELINGGPGVIQAVAAAEGTTGPRIDLTASPVFDGLAVAGGRMFVSQADGRVVCLGG